MAVKPKEQVFAVRSEHRDDLKRFDVKRCGVRGRLCVVKMRPSDVDIRVAFNLSPKSLVNFMNLAFSLEDVLGRRVDFVAVESLSPYIGPHILHEVEYAALNA